MSQPPLRPILKLKMPSMSFPGPAATPTPSSVTTPKIKLKVKKEPTSASVIPSTPASESGIPKLKLKQPKKDAPSKIATGKKREIGSISDEVEAAAPSAPLSAPIKKLKLTTKTPTTPFIRLKPKGRPPPRPLGVGYDSEASDRETDPAIEEEFVLRMQPGPDCEYVRAAIENKNWGKSGAQVKLKFLQTDGRRAVLTIQGNMYAASMVDMPCIVEGMKSWDKRNWYKAADICQMLLVLGLVKNEADAMVYPLPGREVDHNFSFAHGITAPLHWARKRRFRKRVSARTIEEVEEQVERLLRADAEAVGKVKFELVDQGDLQSRMNDIGKGDSDWEGDDYGFGDAVYTEGQQEDNGFEDFQDEDAFIAEMEEAMEKDNDAMEGVEEEAETPADTSFAGQDGQVVTDSEAQTPAAATSKEDSGEEESDEDDDAEEELDEDALEARADEQRQREEINDLENAIKEQKAELERLSNPHLKRKVMAKIQNLQGDLELKRSGVGENVDD